MLPILPPSSDSRQVICKSWSIGALHQPLFPLAVAEGCTVAAGSSTLLGFRPGRIQPSGCSPTRISLEETLLQADPPCDCLALCCTGTSLAQMLESYGEKKQKPNKCRVLIQLKINYFSLAWLLLNYVYSPIQMIGCLHELLCWHCGWSSVWLPGLLQLAWAGTATAPGT